MFTSIPEPLLLCYYTYFTVMEETAGPAQYLEMDAAVYCVNEASPTPPGNWLPPSCHVLQELEVLSSYILWPQTLHPWQCGKSFPAYTCYSEGAVGFSRYVQKLVLVLINL